MKKKKIESDKEDNTSVSSVSSSSDDSSNDDEPLVKTKRTLSLKLNDCLHNKKEEEASADDSSDDDEPLMKTKRKPSLHTEVQYIKKTEKEVNASDSSDDDERLLKTKRKHSFNNYINNKKEEEEGKNKDTSPKSADASSSDTSMNSDDETKRKEKNLSSTKRKRSEDKTDKKVSKKQKLGKDETEVSNKLSSLLRYQRLCGVRVTNYSKMFEGCKTMKSKERKISNMLEELGVSGRPTLQKCKQAKLKREEEMEVAELDMDNIITGGRRRSEASKVEHYNKPDKSSRRYAFSNIADLVDSEASDNEQNTEHSVNCEKRIKKKRVVQSDTDSDVDKENEARNNITVEE